MENETVLPITTKLLGYLSKEISSGRPLAALLRAREYLTAEHPLFRSLVTKAKSQLHSNQYECLRDIVNQVMNGARHASLSSEDHQRILNFREVGVQTTRYIVVPTSDHRLPAYSRRTGSNR